MHRLIAIAAFTVSLVLGQSNLDNKATSSVRGPVIQQKFACLNCYSSTSGYHTGQDLVSSVGDSSIYAAGFGKVVILQPNGQGCAPGCNAAKCGCLDHGFGNAIVIEHTLLDGSKIYTQYGHNSAFAPGLTIGQCVAKGSKIATMGGTGYGLTNAWSTHSHLEFKTAATLGAPDGAGDFGYSPDQPTLHGYIDPAGDMEQVSIWDATAENYRTAANQPPYHPIGTLLRKRNNGTIYVVTSDTTIRGISSQSVLSGLYPNGGFGFEHVIVVSDSEFALYQIGPAVSSALPSNGRTRPDGTLIQSPQGEISIVTNVSGTDGGRRPFSSASVFTGLGYAFCNAISVSQQEYDSYSPVGLPVDGTLPGSSSGTGATGDVDITRLANSSQAVQWFYIQHSGRWYIVSNDGQNQVLVLANADRSYPGIIQWRPLNNASSSGYVSAGANFSSVTISPDGRTITFGSANSSDSDVASLSNTSNAVSWFYINDIVWYIVSAARGTNLAVLKLQDADPTYPGLLIWKPISNWSTAVTQYPAQGIHFSAVTVSSTGQSVQFGNLQ